MSDYDSDPLLNLITSRICSENTSKEEYHGCVKKEVCKLGELVAETRFNIRCSNVNTKKDDGTNDHNVSR